MNRCESLISKGKRGRSEEVGNNCLSMNTGRAADCGATVGGSNGVRQGQNVSAARTLLNGELLSTRYVLWDANGSCTLQFLVALDGTPTQMPKEGITPRSQDYSQWYLDIVRGADLADYAEVVRSCIVFKPTGYAL